MKVCTNILSYMHLELASSNHSRPDYQCRAEPKIMFRLSFPPSSPQAGESGMRFVTVRREDEDEEDRETYLEASDPET